MKCPNAYHRLEGNHVVLMFWSRDDICTRSTGTAAIRTDWIEDNKGG